MDFSVFDGFLDSVFVIDREKRILYHNDALVQLTDLSPRRLKPGKLCYEAIAFNDPELFCGPYGSWGEREATPYKEVVFTSAPGSSGGEKSGRVQLRIQPLSRSDAGPWMVTLRDVTLEEQLHRKYRSELAQKEAAFRELEKYSATLELKVQERTRDLSQVNLLLSGILESLGQGFLIFGSDLRCLNVHSKACLDILESDPSGKPIDAVLRLDEKSRASFRVWTAALFEEKIPFSDLLDLGPKSYAHTRGKAVALEFHPLRDASGCVEGVILVATDRTKEHQALEEARKERAEAERILKLARHKSTFFTFVRDAFAMLAQLRESLRATSPGFRGQCLAWMHTIKGGAASFHMAEVQRLAHGFEESAREATPASMLSQVDALEAAFARFFRANHFLVGNQPQSAERRTEVSRDRLAQFAARLDSKLRADFTDAFLKEPIEKHFIYFGDTAAEMAAHQGKKLNPVAFKGGDLPVLTSRYEGIFGTLIHVFRNAVDHGIESPEERIRAGKPEVATLTVEFSRQGEFVVIRIQDDGRGIDPRRLREILRERFGGGSLDQENDAQILQHIFDEGFSTREEVSDFSGRGVGLSAVRMAVEKVGGSVGVASRVGAGTSFELRIPAEI